MGIFSHCCDRAMVRVACCVISLVAASLASASPEAFVSKECAQRVSPKKASNTSFEAIAEATNDLSVLLEAFRRSNGEPARSIAVGHAGGPTRDMGP